MTFLRKSRRRSTRNTPRSVVVKQVLIGFLCFLVLGLLGYGVWYISHLESLNIENIEVRGGQTISHEQVKRVAEEKLAGAYYKLVPKRFFWTYPQADIVDAINQLPRLKSVTVEEIDRQNLHINIEEYVPYALWCKDANMSDCLFIDNTGYAFSQAPSLSGGALLRYVDKDQQPKIGGSLLNPELIKNTEALADSITANFDLTVSYLESVGREGINYHLADDSVLKIDPVTEPSIVVDNLATILNSSEFSYLQKDGFQYIDLRFGNKVFVKDKTVVVEEEATSTDSDIVTDE